MKGQDVHLYCTCGMAAHLTFKPGTSPQVIQRVASRFYKAGHTGDGHAPCDERTAKHKRREEQEGKGIVFFD
jgi:hypothetical protein